MSILTDAGPFAVVGYYGDEVIRVRPEHYTGDPVSLARTIKHVLNAAYRKELASKRKERR